MREIYFYRSVSGVCPVEAFLARLDGRQAQKIAWVLRLVKELSMIPKQYFKKLEGTQEIWEVRADLGNDAFRKAQKTPAREITLGEQRRADYLNRKKKL